MSYVKATDILPQELLEIIQNYVDGEYIYIPRKEGNKKNWGEKTRTREENIIRNKNIYEEYKKGESIKALAEKYYLSEKSIQRIILEAKNYKKD
ncbi:MAG: CD3324 family protein [Bacillota bacterium]|nr:CD3324 family protein [Bacillota bacterium]